MASEQLPSDNRNFRQLAGVAKTLSEFVALPFRPDAPFFIWLYLHCHEWTDLALICAIVSRRAEDWMQW